MTKTLYLSLGANLGNKAETLTAALALLQEKLGTELSRSSFYETAPWGFASEHTFLNMAAAYATMLSPTEALSVTQEIEKRLGRTEKTQTCGYADRAIDIDLLFFEGETFVSSTLTLPHRHMAQRRFVLAPLAEIAPEALIPATDKSVADHLAQLNQGTITEVLSPTDTALTALRRLLPQLTPTASSFTAEQLTALVNNPTTQLFFLHDELGEIQGTCTLCYASSPTGIKAWLEDVVVDHAARQRGYGRQLVAHALTAARAFGAHSLNLTSRPSRAAANALYQSMGFEQRISNLYTYPL